MPAYASSSPTPVPPTRRRRRLPRILAIAAAALLAVLVGGYFVVTSQWFLRRMISRAVDSQLGATVAVDSIDFNLFSHLGIDGLELTGPAPESDHIQISRLDANYDLWSLLSGEPHITRLEVEGADLSLTRLSDGRLAFLRNLAPSEPSSEGGGRLQIDSLRVLNVALHLSDRATGLPDPLEADLTLDTLTGQSIDTAKGLNDLVLDLRIDRVAQGDHTELSGGHLRGAVNVEMTGGRALAAAASLEAGGFEGRWRGTPIADDSLTLHTAVEADEDGLATVRTGELALVRGGQRAATVSLAGQYSPRTKEGALTVTISDVTHQAFELLMARPGGVDFGDSTADGQVDISLSEGGQQVGVDGHLDLREFSVASLGEEGGQTPPLTLRVAAALTVNQQRQTLSISALSASSDIQGEPLLDARLSQPMTIVLGTGSNEEPPPASIDVTLHQFDIGRMRSLLPPEAGQRLRAGVVSADARLRVQGGGRELTAEGVVAGEDLVLSPAGAALPPLDLHSSFDLTANPSQRHLTIHQSSVEIVREGGEAGVLEVAGDMDFNANEGTVHVRAESFDLTLPGLAMQDDRIALTSGTLDTDTVLTLAQGGEGVDITSQTAWDNLGLVLTSVAPDALPITRGLIQIEARRTPQQMQIENLTADLGDQGQFTASGTLSPRGDGQVTATLTDLNLNLVNTILGPEGPLHIDEGGVSGQATVSRSGDTLTVTFDGTGEMARWTMASTGEAMPPLGARGAATVSVHPESGITVDPLRFAVTSGGEEAGEIQGRVTAAAGASGEVAFDGAVEGVDLAALRPFLGDAGTRLRGGRLGYQGTIHAGRGRAASQGTLTLEDLTATLSSEGESSELEEVGLRAEHDVEVAASHLQVRRARGTITRGGSPAGGFDVSADLDLETREGQAQVSLQEAAIGQFLAALGAANPDVAGAMVADGQQSLAFDPDSGAMSATGQLTLSNLQVNGQSATVQINDNVSVNSETIRVTDTRLSTQMGDRPPQPVTVAADINRTGGDSTLTISGGDVDLTPLYEMLGGGQTQEAAAPTTEPATLPPVPDAGEMRLQGAVTFDRLTINTLQMVQPRVEFAWVGREINLSTLSTQLVGPNNTGQLDGSLRLASASADAPGTYAANLTLTATDMDPILRTFAPGLAEKATGAIILDRVDVRSGGTVLPDDGVIQVTLAEGGLNHIPLLSEIADLTRIDVVRELQFFEGGLTLQAHPGRFTLEQEAPFWVRGQLVILTANGEVFHDGRQELDFTIGLNSLVPRLGELMSSIAGGVAFPVSQNYPDYRIFPLPIHTTGTWGDPRVTLGAPQIEQIVPNILGGLLRGEQLPEHGQPQQEEAPTQEPGLLPNLPDVLEQVIPGQSEREGERRGVEEQIRDAVRNPLEGVLGGRRRAEESPAPEPQGVPESAPGAERPAENQSPAPEEPQLPPPPQEPPSQAPNPETAPQIPALELPQLPPVPGLLPEQAPSPAPESSSQQPPAQEAQAPPSDGSAQANLPDLGTQPASGESTN